MELNPTIGTLTARLFSNEHVGLPLTLFFDIDLPVQPFEFDGEPQETSIRLEFIELPVRDWREIFGRTFRFPINPEPGYIDGSVYIGNVHNPVDVTQIRFAQASGSRVAIVADICVDFTYEGPCELGQLRREWATSLDFDESALDQVFRAASVRGVW